MRYRSAIWSCTRTLSGPPRSASNESVFVKERTVKVTVSSSSISTRKACSPFLGMALERAVGETTAARFLDDGNDPVGAVDTDRSHAETHDRHSTDHRRSLRGLDLQASTALHLPRHHRVSGQIEGRPALPHADAHVAVSVALGHLS